MEILFFIIAFLLIILGIAGCILPVLPGIPLSYAGIILLHLTTSAQFTEFQLIVWLLVVIVLQILDYFTPMLGSKYSGGTEYGNRGCIAGTILGLFFLPWGIILGPFLGAVIGEMLGGSDLNQALKSGFGPSLSAFVFLLFSLSEIIIYFKYLKYTYTVDIARDIIVTIIPYFKKYINEIL